MAAKDLGPLDWKTPIVDSSGRPSPEFQRRWATQRNNNALIGSAVLGSGPPAGTPDDTDEYIDIAATPPALYVGSAGAWLKIGVFAFLQLSDVPSAYTAAAAKLLRVNGAASGVEFASLSAVLDGLSATRGTVLYRGAAAWLALAPGTAGQVLTTGGAGADPAWAAGGGGGGGMTLIAQYTTVLGDTAHTFSAIPGTFSDLDLVVMGRGTAAVTAQSFNILVNGLSTGIYSEQRMFSNAGGTIASDEALAATSFDQHVALAGANASANTAGYMRLRIFNYANTTFKKLGEWTGRQTNSTTTDTAFYLNGNAQFDLTAAISSLTVTIDSGAWVAGSIFSLRGLP